MWGGVTGERKQNSSRVIKKKENGGGGGEECNVEFSRFILEGKVVKV